MSVETMEKPQTEEKEQKCEDTCEKCERCKQKAEYQDTVYKKLLELDDVSHESMAKTIQMDARENNDPLSRFLVHLVENSSIEDKKTLWNEICKTLLAHFSWEEIESKVNEVFFALDEMKKVNGDDFVMVKAINGKKQAQMVFPISFLEEENLKTDEDIIGFAKTRAKSDIPNKDIQDENAEYKVLRGEELNEEMRKSQELLLHQLKGEQECQTNNEQTIKQ